MTVKWIQTFEMLLFGPLMDMCYDVPCAGRENGSALSETFMSPEWWKQRPVVLGNKFNLINRKRHTCVTSSKTRSSSAYLL